MDKQQTKAIDLVISSVLEGDNHKATKYLSEKLIVRASRRLFRGKIRKGNIEIMLVIGKPNYKEREFIRDCKKAKEPFPIRGILLAYPPQKRKKA